MEALLRKRMVYQTDLRKSVVEFCRDPIVEIGQQQPLRDLEEVKVHLEELERKRTAFLPVQESIESKVKSEDLETTLAEH